MRLAPIIEQRIRAESAKRYGALRLPAEFIAPNYAGRSIVNVPASIVATLGGQTHTPPLDAEILDDLSAAVQRVVLVIADAAPYQRLLDALAANPDNGLHALLRAGARLVPLTSTFPSTTTAALTALWSGYTPAQHGFVGYQLFLREYGVRADMITFSPVVTKKQSPQQLVNAGLAPDKFVPTPALPHLLEPLGIPTYGLIEERYVESALSRAQMRGVKAMHGFVTSSDMWVTLRALIEQHRAERALFVAYWSAMDSIAHTYGPTSDALLAELDNLAYSFEREFLRRLAPAARRGTLFLLVADHGQLDTPAARAVYLHRHPELWERLLMDFAGEPRAAYLYCRAGEVEAVREYLTTQLGDKFFVLDSRAALEGGLFGEGTPAPQVKHRIGDLIVLPRDNYYIWDKDDTPKLLGRHGGLAEKEMLVPLIAARLDA